MVVDWLFRSGFPPFSFQRFTITLRLLLPSGYRFISAWFDTTASNDDLLLSTITRIGVTRLPSKGFRGEDTTIHLWDCVLFSPWCLTWFVLCCSRHFSNSSLTLNSVVWQFVAEPTFTLQVVTQYTCDSWGDFPLYHWHWILEIIVTPL